MVRRQAEELGGVWRCRGNRRYLQCANNAPIAGVIFALEVILGDFSTTSLSTVVIASVTANQIARIIHGNLPAFAVTPYTLVSAWELPLYAVLGVVAAVVGVVFVRVLYFSEDVFDAWKFPEPLKPMAGDLLIGMIGFAYPQVLGVGHDAIEQALHNTMPLALMATLVVIKMIATTFVAERMFADSIYTLKLRRRGVRLSQGRDEDVMQTVRVSEVMDTQADSVVSTLSLPALAREFERTHHHSFPVLGPEGNLYGIVSIRDLERAMETEAIDQITAGDIATTRVVTVSPNDPVSLAIERMAPRDLSRLPVVDFGNPRRLLGLIRRGDIGRAYNVGVMRRVERQQRAEQLRQGAALKPHGQFTSLALEELEFIKSMTHGLEIEPCPQGNVIEPMGHTEPCQAARGVDRQSLP
ncbi:Chloride channel protein CLC-f [Geodia barretti]|uniref:Chloride channel protein CLC-f n=1 Tax=Geodia barretti TaxID=519541 RepID=A0AA35SUL0_GEOBA|nr:Chloride channel protein CLC-f [Geodia barretti]